MARRKRKRLSHPEELFDAARAIAIKEHLGWSAIARRFSTEGWSPTSGPWPITRNALHLHCGPVSDYWPGGIHGEHDATVRTLAKNPIVAEPPMLEVEEEPEGEDAELADEIITLKPEDHRRDNLAKRRAIRDARPNALPASGIGHTIEVATDNDVEAQASMSGPLWSRPAEWYGPDQLLTHLMPTADLVDLDTGATIITRATLAALCAEIYASGISHVEAALILGINAAALEVAMATGLERISTLAKRDPNAIDPYLWLASAVYGHHAAHGARLKRALVVKAGSGSGNTTAMIKAIELHAANTPDVGGPAGRIEGPVAPILSKVKAAREAKKAERQRQLNTLSQRPHGNTKQSLEK